MALRVTAALVLALLAFVPAGAQNAFTIGVTLSLSGRYQSMGQMQKRGFQLWLQHQNQAGGLLGRPVLLKMHDDASDPRRARLLYARMIEKDKVDFVFGPYSSGITAAVLPVTERHGYPLLISGAAADLIWQQGYHNAFGVLTPASKYVVGFLQLLVERGIGKLALLAADDPFSKSLAKATRTWAQRLGLNLTLYRTLPKGVQKPAAALEAARQSGAGALVLCGHLQESIAVTRALNRMGWRPRAFYASVGPSLSQYRQILGAMAEGTFSSSLWEPAAGNHFPGGRRFLADFKRRFQVSPSYHAALSYAAGMVLAAAARHAGSLKHARLREALSTMDIMTLIGRYGVDYSGRQRRHFPLIIQWQKGHKRVVWPQGLKETDAVFQ